MEITTNIQYGQELSLYIHIPFCRRICHYCDFAKTANFHAVTQAEYFRKLVQHLCIWLEAFQPRLVSVFIGGGTPSLFLREYEPLFNFIRPYLSGDAEVTLEANPEDIDKTALRSWRDLGINRLSLGVQTFQSKGLKFLTREHTGDSALEAISQSHAVFSNISVDLIYGWQKQSLTDFEDDLAVAVGSDPQHLSLYCLTYEPKTVIGRRFYRNLISAPSDDRLADMYQAACGKLTEHGYLHAEVSNWTKPGAKCLHNHRYWDGSYYIGVGCGAHGYLPGSSNVGTRYSYGDSLKGFLDSSPTSFEEVADRLTVDDRDDSDWLLETITTALRRSEGLDLDFAARKSRRRWDPTPMIDTATDQGLISLSGKHLRISEPEWFRESAWSLAVYDCFV